MKDKILAGLKNKYKNLGFGEKAFEGVAKYLSQTVTEESQIDEAITGVESLLKAFQGDTDQVRRENARLKTELGITKPEEIHSETPPANDIQRIIAEALKPLTDKITALESGKTHDALSSALANQLKEKNIPVEYYSPAIEGRTLQSENDVQTLVTKLETSYKAFQQKQADAGLGEQGLPPRGDVTTTTGDAVKKDIDRLATFD